MSPSKQKTTSPLKTPKPSKVSVAPKTVEPRERASIKLVVVYESSGPLAAEVIKGKLESEGIAAMIKTETAESVFPVTVNGLGKVQVLVHEEDEQKARKILKP